MLSKLRRSSRLRNAPRRAFDFRFFARFRKDTRGGVLIYTAFILPIILGVAGMSVDMGTWYASKRVAQAAADSGALAGALEVMRINQDPSEPDITEAEIAVIATAIASDNGYDYGAGDEIEVNYPPDNGSYAGAGDAVEVIRAAAGQRLPGASSHGRGRDHRGGPRGGHRGRQRHLHVGPQ